MVYIFVKKSGITYMGVADYEYDVKIMENKIIKDMILL